MTKAVRQEKDAFVRKFLLDYASSAKALADFVIEVHSIYYAENVPFHTVWLTIYINHVQCSTFSSLASEVTVLLAIEQKKVNEIRRRVKRAKETQISKALGYCYSVLTRISISPKDLKLDSVREALRQVDEARYT
jgi:hypothetical protein